MARGDRYQDSKTCFRLFLYHEGSNHFVLNKLQYTHDQLRRVFLPLHQETDDFSKLIDSAQK